MTTTKGPGGKLAATGQPLMPSEILVLCDRVLDELGRRLHLFAWLRAPTGGSESWLPVDAYYPANRLVVLVRPAPSPEDRLYDELVPAHGLHLLRVAPTDLPHERDAAESAIARAIAELGPTPPRPTGRSAMPGGPSPVTQALSALAHAPSPSAAKLRRGPSQAEAAERAARFVAAHPTEHTAARRPVRPGSHPVHVPPHPPRRHPPFGAAKFHHEPARDDPTVGVMVGLTLVVVLVIEVYAGVTRAGLDRGQVLLAFGLALDACARALGTIAASHTGDRGWAWACALGGSPFVAGFVMFQEKGPVTVDPAPLAGLIALLAMLATAVAIVF